MKKALSIILVLALACSLFGGAALAAASDYVFTGGSVTVDGTTDKTIEVKFTTVQGGTFTAFQADWSLKETESSSYLTLSALTSDIAEDAMENDPSTGKTVWANLNLNKPKDNLTVEKTGAIWTATYTVDKNTPTGEYTVQLDVKSITDEGGNAIADAMGTRTAKITVTNTKPVAEGYTVTAAADKSSAAVGDTVNINLNVTNSDSSITTFNAFYGTLTYNATVFTYAGNDRIGTFNIDASVSGELKIARADGNITISGSDPELTIPFTAASMGTGTFVLSEFQVSQAALANGNASVANVSGTPKVTVSQTYTVTFEGGSGATGNAPTLTGGNTVADGSTIKLPNNTFKKEGWTFSKWSDGKNEYDEGDEYTVTGDVIFTAQWSKNYTVAFEGGTGATGNPPALTGGNTVADGTEIILPNNTFSKDGYTFSKWSDGQNEYGEGDKYTVTGDVTFTAQWKENTPDPTVTVEVNDNYLDGYKLIKATIENADGNVPTYDGTAMFQVENTNGKSIYDETAYYYVVKAADYNADLVSYAKKSAVTITKDGDANQTGLIDINDAQFVYNLYGSSVSYTYEPKAAQLLASDVNGDGSVDTLDCAAAIAAIK